MNDYKPSIDGLRAIAVGFVLYWHWIPSKYHFGFGWGTAGVQLFFVISGFLITRILIRCWKNEDRGKSLRTFYIRRALRIFPVFYLVLVVAYLFDIDPVRETIIWHVTYFSNFYFLLRGDFHGQVSHFWSLAVEEQFYSFWPLIVLFLPKCWLVNTILLVIAVGVLTNVFAPEYFLDAADNWIWMVLPNANFIALGLGALLATTTCQLNSSKWTEYLPLAAPIYIGLIIAEYIGISIHYVFFQTTLVLTFSYLILVCFRDSAGTFQKVLSLSCSP